VFGGPYGGLFEICSSQGVDISRFDFVVNVIPNQGTATVRTEEALLATLAILNVMFS
jgi:predicted SPOUT superfamily RNA methylase MTH1